MIFQIQEPFNATRVLAAMKNIKLRLIERFKSSTPNRFSSRKPVKAAILHLDIVGSTTMVKQDLLFAHHQIGQLYRRIAELCRLNRGFARELRGDAVVAEFENADDALNAALAIQASGNLVSPRFGRLNPQLRIGISFGEVISEKNMITGQAVIRAQRLEQLAEAGQIVVDDLFRERLSGQLHRLRYAGSESLKGFSGSTEIYRVEIDAVRQQMTCPGTLLHGESSCAI